MTGHSLEVAARRAGVSPADVARLTDLGILGPAVDGTYSDADVRRVIVVQALERAGLSVDGLGQLVRDGRFSLRFVDDAGHQVFAPLSETTFAQLAERTGIPVEMLLVLRDVTGGKTATDIGFEEIGPVEVKGVAGAIELFAVRQG